jgi:hypothetical protein
MLNQQLPLTIKTLSNFTNDSLGLDLSQDKLSGFDYSVDILEASSYNTYLETNSSKSDSLYRHIKSTRSDLIIHSYLTTIKLLSKRLKLREKSVMLAFDYTDEDFYGNVQGLNIHGSAPKEKTTGKFKFLTCNLVDDEIPERIPLLSTPIQIGHNMSREVLYILQLLSPYLGNIELIIFDRGYYSKELMASLFNAQYKYLIFVPKNKHIQNELSSMTQLEKKLIPYNFKYTKGNSKENGLTYLAFLKQLYSKSLDKNIDWCFSTNVKDLDLNSIIKTYKKRWRIENSFKIQNDAQIKTKSVDMKIRFFFFVYQQLLESLWYCLYKDKLTFKKFIIEISKKSSEMQLKQKSKKKPKN